MSTFIAFWLGFASAGATVGLVVVAMIWGFVLKMDAKNRRFRKRGKR